MKCPFCHKSEIKTLETREVSESTNRRRKECINCKNRFTTYETIELKPIMVIKNNNSKQPFDKQKIVDGLRRACEKRPIPESQIQTLADEIVAKVLDYNKSEIKSRKIGLYVLNRLKKVDMVAYMRFASVYRDFEKLEQFETEVNKLQK